MDMNVKVGTTSNNMQVNNANRVKEGMQVRGKIIRILPKFVSNKFGKEGLQRWLEEIPAEAQLLYSYSVKDNEWYPLRASFIEPTANIARLFYDWDLKAASWAIGRDCADSILSLLTKIFGKSGSPKAFVKKAGEVIAAYYRPVETDLVEISPNCAILRILRFPEMDRSVEYRMAGWIERALEINGCRHITIDVPKSLTAFQPCTEIKVSWN